MNATNQGEEYDATLKPGDRVYVRDARGDRLSGVVEYGPARDRDGIRGTFVKYWIVVDQSPDADPIPWPATDVRREDDSLPPRCPRCGLDVHEVYFAPDDRWPVWEIAADVEHTLQRCTDTRRAAVSR